jgi:hypothetical protein
VARIEILDVSVPVDGWHELRGAKIDQPTPGVESTALKIVGWVVGRECPAVAVEVVSGDRVVGSAPVNIERPGVAEAFDDAPGAKSAGFRVVMEASGKGESELLVTGVLEDGTHAPVATIRSKVSRRSVLQALRRR